MRCQLAARDHRLSYEDDGEGVRGTILALHSLGTDHRLWNGSFEVWREAGYRVLRPDARGHGGSGWSPLDGASGWVDDLTAVLDDAVPTGSVDVIGASMGVAQAMELTLAVPDRVGRMVLTGAFGDLPPDDGQAKVDALVGGARSEGLVAWADNYVETTLFTPDPGRRAAVRDAIQRLDLAAYAASAEACFSPRSGPLDALPHPTAVVWGELDVKTPREMSEQLCRQLPHAELVLLPDAGHLAPIDRPRAFADVVLAFLDRSEGPTERSDRRSRREDAR